MSSLINVTDYSFDAQVLKCDIPVLADFWAEWCEPCKALEPHLEAIATADPQQVKIVKVDLEDNPATTSNYTVLTIPTLILFKNGQEVVRLHGSQSKQSILEKISPHFDH